MIDSIVGTINKKGVRVEGLIDIFEAVDEDTGKPVVFTKKSLREMDTDELIELYRGLLLELEKNI